MDKIKLIVQYDNWLYSSMNDEEKKTFNSILENKPGIVLRESKDGLRVYWIGPEVKVIWLYDSLLRMRQFNYKLNWSLAS